MARRVDRDGALHILGVGVRAFDSYRPDPTFPKADGAGRYSVTELEAWKAAQPKPTRGAPKGQAKPKGLYACVRCGTKVPRRWPFPATGEGREMLCKPCLRAAHEKAEEGGTVVPPG